MIMSRCFTWFPICGLGEPHIITSNGLFYNGVGKIVEEICTRIDGCRIIDNVCLDCEIVIR